MNQSAHTPGPWLNGWGKVTDSDGKAICMVVHRKNGDNGSLIASAPDLLRALQRLVLEVESICAHEAGSTRDMLIERLHKDWDGKILDSRRAISKAKGQE